MTKSAISLGWGNDGLLVRKVPGERKTIKDEEGETTGESGITSALSYNKPIKMYDYEEIPANLENNLESEYYYSG